MRKAKAIILFCALVVSGNIQAYEADYCLTFQEVSSSDWQKMAGKAVAVNLCGKAINAWWCSEDEQADLRCPQGGLSQISPYGRTPAFTRSDLFPPKKACFVPNYPLPNGSCG